MSNRMEVVAMSVARAVSLRQRALLVALTVLAGIGTMLTAGPYLVWAQSHNTLLYAAVEVGRRPLFAPGHFVSGAILGGLFAACLALLGISVVRLFARGPGTRWARIPVTFVALAMSGAITLAVLSPVYAMGPILLAAAIVAVLGGRKLIGRGTHASRR